MTNNGKDGTDIERLAEARCTSFDEERRGHTHRCRMTKGHDGKHACICKRNWEHEGQARA